MKMVSKEDTSLNLWLCVILAVIIVPYGFLIAIIREIVETFSLGLEEAQARASIREKHLYDSID